MRYHVTLALTGVSRFIWYAYDNCNWGTFWEAPWCTNSDNLPAQLTPPGHAYGVIEQWLVGASIAQCQQSQNGLWVCELILPGHSSAAWMIWSSTGTEIDVPIPESSGLTDYRDWQNNMNDLSSDLTVGGMPILLESSNP
jgi:hypothetical protein